MDFPYKKRLRNKAAASSTTILKADPPPGLGHYLMKIFGGIVHLTGVFVASMAGAVIASFASVYITLTTLESFKAEESLRQFAISDLYRPLREKSSECLSSRSAMLSEMNKYVGLLKAMDGYANQYKTNERLQEANLAGVEEIVKPILEEMSNAIKKISEGRATLVNCQYIVNNMALEIATVLGSLGEYENMRNEAIKARPNPVSMVSENDPIISLFTNPAGTVALLLALKDGSEGDVFRMASALTKLKKQLEDAVNRGEKSIEYEEKMLALAYKEDLGRTRLFLVNLKNRFEITPKSTLSQLFGEIGRHTDKYVNGSR